MNSVIIQETAGKDERIDYENLSASLLNLSTEQAIFRIKEFLITFPSFALAHNDLAVLYHRSGNTTLALAHHEKASRLQPDNVLFRKNLADFYAVELGWLEEAVDIYLEILKRNPRDTEALIALGQLGKAMSGSGTLEVPQAKPQLEISTPEPAAPAMTVKTDQERYQEAQELATKGYFIEAASLLEELTRNQPHNALYYNDLGVVRYQTGDIQRAQVCYERAATLAPENSLYARNLADLYFTQLNRADDAIRIYLDLHSKSPRDLETLINLGHISAAVGRPDEAKTFYRRALEIEPWNKEAREALADQSKSPAQLQQASPPQSLIPPKPFRPAQEILGEARQQMQQGQPAEARKLLEEAVSQNPRLAVAHNDLGVVVYSLGDITAAQSAYEEAVRLEPGNLNFTMNLADLYFAAAGRPDDAIRIYLELFRKYPRNIEVLTALGRICQAVARPDEAKTFYRRVLEIEPWNREVREALQGL